jgi:hypothetical protein
MLSLVVPYTFLHLYEFATGIHLSTNVLLSFLFHTSLEPFGSLRGIWLLNHSLPFEATTDPVDTSAQAALAPHQTTEQEECADTNFMVM